MVSSLKAIKKRGLFYLRNQLLLIIALITLAFAASIMIIVLSYNRVITGKIGTISRSYMSTVNSSLSLLENNTRQIASLLKNSSTLQDALSFREYDVDTVYNNNRQVRSSLVNIMHANSYIGMIYICNSIYDYQSRINSAIENDDLSYADIDSVMKQNSEQNQLHGLWLTSSSLGLSEEYPSLFFIQKIRNLNTLRPIGYIVIEVDPSFLDEALSLENFDTGITFAFLKDGLLLYQNGTMDPDAILDVASHHKSGTDPETDYLSVTDRDTKYYLTVTRNIPMDLDLLSLIPAGVLTGDIQQLYLLVAIVLIILLIVLFIITWRFSSSVVSQVAMIKELFEAPPEPGSNAAPLPFRGNEIGQIGMECENLLKRYNHSMQHTYELLIKQKETDLLRLQEQINPHFLYNTLNSIYWMCQSSGASQAATMALYLSRYFRSNLRQNTVTSSIRIELDRIRNYLAIQNIRYNDKFELITEIDEELMEVQIMRMLLQPLIENAIFHGLEPKEGKGVIRLSAVEQDNYLIIRVSDDGVGFAEENLIKGIALKNIEERIVLFYGPSCGMQIQSSPGVGTTITLTLLKEIKNYV